MSISLLLPLSSSSILKRTQQSFPKNEAKPRKPFSNFQFNAKPLTIRCSLKRGRGGEASAENPRWGNLLATAASLYPAYVTVGGIVACTNPSAFSWFSSRGPASTSLSLGFVMLAMGLTLELKDLFAVMTQKPLSILAGCVAQYTILPSLGVIISKSLGLPTSISVGLILLACCPGGAASNVVTLIAQGDVPLSIVMTTCTTLSAVIMTPLLTKVLPGSQVPVDAIKLSVSTLQVVVAPILLGSFMQSAFPSLVEVLKPLAPLLAVLVASLLASSTLSESVVYFKSLMISTASGSSSLPLSGMQAILSGEMRAVITSVLLLHFPGFFVGYLFATICGLRERQRRAISIEVGMQNSVLGVVLATSHFNSPLVVLPAAVSAVIMNIMGSSLGFIWRYMKPSDKEQVEATS